MGELAMNGSAAKPVAIVTAASSGIGLGAVRALAARGYALVIMSRSAKINDVAQVHGATAMQGDVTDPAALAALVELAMKTHGRIDGAVVNTGHPPGGDVLKIADEDWQRGMDIVLMPTVRMTQLLAPIFAAQKSGAVVAISSYAAREPSLAYPLSSVFRAGLANFIKLCATKYGGEGWRINAVLPGFIDNYPEDPDIVAKIPLGRYGHADSELGATIAFLLSQDAGYITGQGILVDGGIMRAL
jgi:NAD(P)-dependent dehydrogenase (short-subunit alcohol dehydrogenase family)